MGYEYFYGIQADQFTFYRVPKLFFMQEEYRCMTTMGMIGYDADNVVRKAAVV